MSVTPVGPDLVGEERPVSAELPYDAAKSSEGYANVTGLVSTFALAAVVLVFLIAATPSSPIPAASRADMGFATILFSVSFLGCLLAAFQFAALAGAPKKVALTNSMLIASVVAVCLIAVLAGFEALAKAFIHTSAPVFTLITWAAAALSPIFVFFPMFDYAREAKLAGVPLGECGIRAYGGWATKIVNRPAIVTRLPGDTDEAELSMIALLLDLTVAATLAATVGWVVHQTSVLGHPHQWMYYIVAILALGVIGLATIEALLLAAEPDRKLSPGQARLINGCQIGLMFVIIATLP